MEPIFNDFDLDIYCQNYDPEWFSKDFSRSLFVKELWPKKELVSFFEIWNILYETIQNCRHRFAVTKNQILVLIKK